jgi:hypothetical protein
MTVESRAKALNSQQQQVNTAVQENAQQLVVRVIPFSNGYITLDCIHETEVIEDQLLQKYSELKRRKEKIINELRFINNENEPSDSPLQSRIQALKKELYNVQSEYRAAKELYFCVKRALNSSRFVLPEHFIDLEDKWIEAVLATLGGKRVRIKSIETGNPHLVIRCALSKILGQPQVINS